MLATRLGADTDAPAGGGGAGGSGGGGDDERPRALPTEIARKRRSKVVSANSNLSSSFFLIHFF